MSSVLDKRTAIVELFKAGDSRQDISKSLKVSRMLVWKTWKRYDETGDIQNRPEQGRSRTARTPKVVKFTREKIRRNPKRSIQYLAKVKCVVWNHVNCSPEGLEDILIQECQETPSFCSSCWETTPKMQNSSFPHARWHAAKPCFQWWEETWCRTPLQHPKWSSLVEEWRWRIPCGG